MSVAGDRWTDQAGATIDPATFRMVPGDTVTYSANVTPDLVGDHLAATLSVNPGTFTGTMAEFATVTTTVGGQDNRMLTSADNGTDIPVKVTINLPFSTGAGNGIDGEDSTLDLSSVKLSLVQNANPPA